MGQILLFGATGYTGRLAARELVRAGAAPVLLGREHEKLSALVAELEPLAPPGRGPSFDVADLTRPGSLRHLLTSPDDVLVSTIGPYSRVGAVAVEAAIHAGCAYVDCAVEPAFLRRVFEEYGPKARHNGTRLLTAMGHDFVAGNLAGALLADRCRDRGLTRLEIGYFVAGPFTPSSGSVASAAAVALDPSFGFHSGKVTTERPGASVRSFAVGDETMTGLSMGGTEVFSLPRLHPNLEQVSVYVGWAGRWSKLTSAAGVLTANALAVPGVSSAMGAVVRTTLGGASATGPAEHVRAKCRSVAVAEGFDAAGASLGQLQVEGPNPYDLTAALLSWSARMLARRADRSSGALGPVDAFGPEALVSACLALGLAEVR